MTVEQVRAALHERISRGASVEELESLLASRDLTDGQRRALRAEARRRGARQITRRQLDAARSFLRRVHGRSPR